MKLHKLNNKQLNIFSIDHFAEKIFYIFAIIWIIHLQSLTTKNQQLTTLCL